jgi:hypothetical protein
VRLLGGGGSGVLEFELFLEGVGAGVGVGAGGRGLEVLDELFEAGAGYLTPGPEEFDDASEWLP